MVSKEEVAVGRKGSGGAWGSTSRNAGLAGPAPQNWTPGAPAPAEVLASRGVVVVVVESWSWQVASCRSYLCSREGGPHTSPAPVTS
jgi:hypothetical protein